MKKSEIKLIMVGIGALVISVILAVITCIVFLANLTASADFSKIQEGCDSIRDTVQGMADDFDEMRDLGSQISVPEIDADQISDTLQQLEEI